MLLVALVACLIVFFVVNNKVSANINLVIANYSDAKCTRIPVNVEGNNVDETMFVNARGEGLQLKNGEYELSFPSSPLSEEGKFWAPPTSKIKMTLKDGRFEEFNENKIEFKDADIMQVTDAQISAAAEVAKFDPENSKDIDTYVLNTKKARDKAIQDAEAQRKATEAEKAQALTFTVTRDQFANATLSGTVKDIEFPHAQRMMTYKHLVLDSPITVTYKGKTQQVTELELMGNFLSYTNGTHVSLTGRIIPGDLDYVHSADFIFVP